MSYEPGRRPARTKPPSTPEVAVKEKPEPVSCAVMVAPGRPPVSSFTTPRTVALVDCAEAGTAAARTAASAVTSSRRRIEIIESSRGDRGRKGGDSIARERKGDWPPSENCMAPGSGNPNSRRPAPVPDCDRDRPEVSHVQRLEALAPPAGTHARVHGV